MILGLDVHPQLTRQNHVAAVAAQNNADNIDGEDDDSDSDDDYVYVLVSSDEEE